MLLRFAVSIFYKYVVLIKEVITYVILKLVFLIYISCKVFNREINMLCLTENEELFFNL